MGPLDLDQQLAAAIRNRCWHVRAAQRSLQRELRAKAIAALGLVVRDAFNQSENFEVLLLAIIDGLAAPDYKPPF